MVQSAYSKISPCAQATCFLVVCLGIATVFTPCAFSSRANWVRRGYTAPPVAAAPAAAQNSTVPLTVWLADIHDGVRADLTSMLTGLGHRVILAGYKGNATPHPTAFQGPGVEQVRRRSPVIADHTTHSTYMAEGDVQRMFDF